MMKESRDPNRRGRRQAGDSATLLKTNEGKISAASGRPQKKWTQTVFIPGQFLSPRFRAAP